MNAPAPELHVAACFIRLAVMRADSNFACSALVATPDIMRAKHCHVQMPRDAQVGDRRTSHKAEKALAELCKALLALRYLQVGRPG